MLDTCWSWPSTYSSHLIIVNINLAVFNNVAKVIHATLCKCAFLWLCIQFVLTQLFKDNAQMLNMLTRGLGVHQNTIQVHSDILIKHVQEYILYQVLKHGRSICQT